MDLFYHVDRANLDHSHTHYNVWDGFVWPINLGFDSFQLKKKPWQWPPLISKMIVPTIDLCCRSRSRVLESLEGVGGYYIKESAFRSLHFIIYYKTAFREFVCPHLFKIKLCTFVIRNDNFRYLIDPTVFIYGLYRFNETIIHGRWFKNCSVQLTFLINPVFTSAGFWCHTQTRTCPGKIDTLSSLEQVSCLWGELSRVSIIIIIIII